MMIRMRVFFFFCKVDFLFRERESHSAHLKSIEAELDAQMAKVEQQAIAKAKQEYDNEKRSLQSKMDAELTELQTQLRLFQKVDSFINLGPTTAKFLFL